MAAPLPVVAGKVASVILAKEMIGTAFFEHEEILHLGRWPEIVVRDDVGSFERFRTDSQTHRLAVRQTSFTLPSASNHAAGLFASLAKPRSSGLSRRVHGPEIEEAVAIPICRRRMGQRLTGGYLTIDQQ